MSIRVLLVDDEELGRRRIREIIAAEADVEIVGESSDGEDAVAKIEALRPDLVFLDIQMPEMDGFEVLQALEPGQLPVVVFVTAYDEFALRAFEANALDYVLKPFYRPRLLEALERARARLGRESSDIDQRLRRLLSEIPRERRFAERFMVRIGGRILFVRTEQIDYLEADGNYVKLHASGKSHLVRSTLASIAERLDPERFLRIHRSSIVNVDRIREVQHSGRGTYVLILLDGTRLPTSASHREAIERLISGAA